MRRNTCKVFATLFVLLSIAIPSLGATAATAQAASSTSMVTGNVNLVSPATVTISIYRMPTAQQLANLQPGDVVPWHQVARTTATASGVFNVTTALPSGNMWAVATTANDEVGSWAFPYNKGSPETIPISLSRVAVASSDGPEVGVGHCQLILDYDMGPQSTLVGQTYVETDAVHQTFDYTRGQSSTLGVGFSATAGFGTFKASGTQNESSSQTYNWPMQGGDQNVHYWTSFDYQMMEQVCDGLGITGYYPTPGVFSGGDQISNPATAPPVESSRYCRSILKGTSFSSGSWEAVNWTAGVAMWPTIGFDATAETGYDSGAVIHYDFLAGGRDLCGTNTYSGDAQQLVVRAS
ncbi:MAG TPA: hypothetical protein VMR18_02700 [Candidatus Saccharimonadales bacterium]|nr:hypothetical protein [Candidatus Saccharimonadales bacterium]